MEFKEESLERERTRGEPRLLERAVEASQNGLVLTGRGRDEPIVYAKRGFERITGFASSEAIGRNLR